MFVSCKLSREGHGIPEASVTSAPQRILARRTVMRLCLCSTLLTGEHGEHPSKRCRQSSFSPSLYDATEVQPPLQHGISHRQWVLGIPSLGCWAESSAAVCCVETAAKCLVICCQMTTELWAKRAGKNGANEATSLPLATRQSSALLLLHMLPPLPVEGVPESAAKRPRGHEECAVVRLDYSQ